jgi:hypothetical protein
MNAQLAKPIPSQLVYPEIALDWRRSLAVKRAKAAGFRSDRRAVSTRHSAANSTKSDAATHHKYD